MSSRKAEAIPAYWPYLRNPPDFLLFIGHFEQFTSFSHFTKPHSSCSAPAGHLYPALPSSAGRSSTRDSTFLFSRNSI